MPVEPIYFPTPEALRAWFTKNHAAARELLVGFYKSHAGRESITWPQSVAEALCFGWIDGIRRTVDEDRYTIRFTPRRPTSKWSAINIRLMRALEAAGKMTPAGRAVFEARKDQESEGYKAQKKSAEFDAARLKLFKQSPDAWKFFRSQPPGYQRNLAWWVMQAKQDETRNRRLRKLIEISAQHRRLL